MKRFTKVCLMIAAVLVILGVSACAAGAVMGAGTNTLRELWRSGDIKVLNWHVGEDGIGWISDHDFDWEDGKESVTRFQTSEVSGIVIDLKHGSLEIEESDTDEIVVEVEKDNGDVLTTLEEGVLTLKDQRSGSTARKDCEVKLELPRGMELQNLKIENNAGVLECDDVFLTADRVDIKVDAGEMDINRIAAKEFYLEVGAGDADIQSLDAESIEISCGLGNIDLHLVGQEKDYNYRLECGLGNIDLGRESYTSIGKEKSLDNGASKDVRIECGMGDISVDTE